MASLDDIYDELLAMDAARVRPPVQAWRPALTGNIDIRIAADGTWHHEGAPIRRESLVRLFASILRRDPEGYCLVTPAERLFINVEDAPFIAVDLEIKGAGDTQSLLFLTNVGDAVVMDPAHPLRMGGDAREPRPYILVRDRLEARISRAVFYRLVNLAEARVNASATASGGDGTVFSVRSAGCWFDLGTA